MLAKLQEGSCSFYASVGKISSKLPVFYNPEMKLNRDISILLLASLPDRKLRVLDLLAGSGIRAVRFLKELGRSKIKEATVNDNSKESARLIKKNLKLNRVNANVFAKDANELLAGSGGFDYIDIDPFGSPNQFLDNSIKRLSRNSILAVTATDTSALSGSFISACRRKYWATPVRNYMMHETGMRILIRKVQLVAAQYDKALIPLFSHSTRHYMRVYFRCTKSKAEVDKVVALHKYLLFCSSCLEVKGSPQNKCLCCKKEMAWAGPLWTGRLWDNNLAAQMLKKSDAANKDLVKLLKIVYKESKISVPFFYSIPVICKNLRQSQPKQDLIMEKSGSVQTHFALEGIRTKMNINKLKKIIQAL